MHRWVKFPLLTRLTLVTFNFGHYFFVIIIGENKLLVQTFKVQDLSNRGESYF
jgi:hypothetical protein